MGVAEEGTEGGVRKLSRRLTLENPNKRFGEIHHARRRLM
jgi:hypothetical protein